MDYVTLGRSGLKVSRICLGAMNFGTAAGFGVNDARARPIIDAYLDAGHNFIDTAGNYHAGQSEEIVGRAAQGKRDAVVIATKGFMPTGPGPNDRGLSRVHLSRALDASLRRLGTDHIDLYQCHFPDPDTPSRRPWRPWTASCVPARSATSAVPSSPPARSSRRSGQPSAWALPRGHRPGLGAQPARRHVGHHRPPHRRAAPTEPDRLDLELPAELVSRLDEASGPAPTPVTGVTVRV